MLDSNGVEFRFYLCRPCRLGNTRVYPHPDHELCPRLPEHGLCPECGQQMEEHESDVQHDVIERETLKDFWHVTDAEIDAAIAAGRLPAYGSEPEKFHYHDHVISAFGPAPPFPKGTWKRPHWRVAAKPAEPTG